MRMNEHGLTLVEIIAAAVIGTLIAAGTMMAFVTATRISRASPTESAAVFLAQQTIERFRNRVACDDPWYDGPPNCDPDPANLPGLGTPDPIPASSLLATYGGERTYRVTRSDCAGGVGFDCLEVETKVTWTPP